jgi:hypothetical protein
MTPAFVVATYRRFALQSVGCGAKGGIAPVLLLKKQEKQVKARAIPSRKSASYCGFPSRRCIPPMLLVGLARVTPHPDPPPSRGRECALRPSPLMGEGLGGGEHRDAILSETAQLPEVCR